VSTVAFTRRQTEILDELSTIIEAEGFAELTVADLADRLRCSRRTLYTLAASRDELIVAVVERLFARWLDAADAAASQEAGVGSICAFVVAELSVADPRPVFFSDVAATPETSAAHQRYRAARLGRLGDLIGAASNSMSEQRPRTVVAELLDALVGRIRQLRQGDPPIEPVAVDQLQRLVRAWLAPPQERATRRVRVGD
jgi:AcrR family transcriptional regulator